MVYPMCYNLRIKTISLYRNCSFNKDININLNIDNCKELTPSRNSRHPCSTSSTRLHIIRVKTKAGIRAFSVAAPTMYNSLPASAKSEGFFPPTSKKTYPFNAAYTPYLRSISIHPLATSALFYDYVFA